MDQKDVIRCSWCGNDPVYTDYHDNEWGRPVRDDQVLFEFIILEGAQAGLSWITVLRKREAYREAFAGFDPRAVAAFTEADVERIMTTEGVICNRAKINSAVTNARLFLDICREYGSFADYIYSFMPEGVQTINNDIRKMEDIPCSSPLSDAISKDMKKRGFKFFGTMICYSFLQATGFIDDHINDCFCKGK